MQLALIYVESYPEAIAVCAADDAILCILDHYLKGTTCSYKDDVTTCHQNNEMSYTIEISYNRVWFDNYMGYRSYWWETMDLWTEGKGE